ncbi:GmrSD restriction endonuclease domain-containing protein [Micromonospora globbae]|uniref:GmrSD restriction endonuclease domain-containing protein n=1 Tax=Micromonospora globbae TaxID=1894969 RepID=UPI00341E3B03
MVEAAGEKPAFRDPRPTAERILPLAERVLNGDILLPSFQRGFVWNRKQMLELLDSVARNYPIGSMLLWQTRQELRSVRNIADLTVADTRPDYPVNYLLDGQQRLSTICGALYWRPGAPDSIWNIGYDLRLQRFFHLDSVDGFPQHQIPVRSLANPSTFFTQLINLSPELQERGKRLFDRFSDYLVPTVTLGDMTIQDVAPVFERINSTGTPLTIVDLMRAATWTPTFDLVDAIDDVLTRLEPKNFHSIDRKTVLRIIAAAAGLGFSAGNIDDLRNRAEPELRQDVAAATESARRAADFLATQIGVPSSSALPYANQFAVLTEIFRQLPNPSDRQYTAIRYWFWRTTLSSYFGGWNTGQMAADLQAIKEFAAGSVEEIATSSVLPSASIWTAREFRSNSATSKMLAIMLAHQQPVDLLTGQRIDVGKSLSWSNDKEYHHFFPRDYLKAQGVPARRANSIANIILLTSISNIRISNKPPSVYLADIREAVGDAVLQDRLRRSLVSEKALAAALNDDFKAFLNARASDLQEHALKLAGERVDVAVPSGSSFVGDDLDSDTTD